MAGLFYARRLMRRAIKEAVLRTDRVLQKEIELEESMPQEAIAGRLPRPKRLRAVQRRLNTIRAQCAKLEPLVFDGPPSVEVRAPSTVLRAAPWPSGNI